MQIGHRVVGVELGHVGDAMHSYQARGGKEEGERGVRGGREQARQGGGPNNRNNGKACLVI